MAIYTKGGDKGETSLFDGTRVPKDSLRVETYGTFDELNANISLADKFCESKRNKKLLQEVEYKMFFLQGEIATEKRQYFTDKSKIITDEDTRRLEKVIDEYNETHTSFNCIEDNDKWDVYELIKKHKAEFGDSRNFEANHYDGYTIDQKFRIKSRGGYSNIIKMRYIVDNDFEQIVASYELPSDYGSEISVGYVLNSLFDLVRSGEY